MTGSCDCWLELPGEGWGASPAAAHSGDVHGGSRCPPTLASVLPAPTPPRALALDRVHAAPLSPSPHHSGCPALLGPSFSPPRECPRGLSDETLLLGPLFEVAVASQPLSFYLS